MIAEEIATDLQGQGIGTLSIDLFIGNLPNEPDNAVVVIDTGSLEPDKYLPFSRTTFQILVRNKTYAQGRAKLEAIKLRLHQLANIVMGEKHVFYILANSDGGHVGRDDSGRELFSINFRTETRPRV